MARQQGFVPEDPTLEQKEQLHREMERDLRVRGIKNAFNRGRENLGNWFNSVREKFRRSSEGRKALRDIRAPLIMGEDLPFIKKLFFVILGGLGSYILYYFTGLSVMWCIVIFMAFTILILSRRTTSRNILNIIVILIVLVGLIYLLIMFFPLLQVYRQQSSQSGFWQKTGTKVSDFFTNTNAAISNYVETQVECASGNCPRGEAEGENVGMTISQPQLLIPDKEYKENEDVTVFSDVEGMNLRVYDEITATPDCTIEAKKGRTVEVNKSIAVQPSEIPFIDISNKKRTIRCVLKTIQTNTYLNKINITLTFPFSTTSDLKMYVMDESRRNLMMKMWSDDFLYTHYHQELDPISKFNDGPVNLGISVNQIPIAVGKSETPAEVSFAMFNQWGYYGGEISKINDIKIEVPNGVEIFTTTETKDFCPFEKSGENTYVLKKDYEFHYPIKTVRSFICGLKVKNIPDQSFDLWMPHIRITADYDYIMRGQLELFLKQPETAVASGAEIDSGGEQLQALAADCSNADTSTLPDETFVNAYESGDLKDRIQTGLNNAITSEYKPDWLTEAQMRDMLLGIMIEESGVGTNMAKNAEGIPWHIAGCTSEDKAGIPLYVEYSVEGDILCAAERIKSYVRESSYCKDYVNAEPEEKLNCALKTYNGHESYAVSVESDMIQWHNYFCSKQTGTVVQ